MSSVDVVIPTFNARELMLRCLQRLDDPAIAQTVVVDDASTDGTSCALSERFPEAHIVVLDRHRGLAHALNRGAEVGTAEFVLFLNNDVFPVDGAIGHLCGALRDHPLAASAGGRLVNPGTERTQDAYEPRALPGLLGLAVRLSGIERAWPRNPWTGQHLRRPLDAVATTQTDRQPAGACLLVRREAFERVQGWDEGYWFWYEGCRISLGAWPSLEAPSTCPRRFSSTWAGRARAGRLATSSTSAFTTAPCAMPNSTYRAGSKFCWVP